MIKSKELATKVQEMRQAQNEFFRTKTFVSMDKAKKLEREVDGICKQVLSYGEPVTGNLFEQKTSVNE